MGSSRWRCVDCTWGRWPRGNSTCLATGRERAFRGTNSQRTGTPLRGLVVVGYSCVHHYSSQKPGIILPVTLRSNAQSSTVPASVDTGASYCHFARAHAEALGLSVEAGERLIFSTANSSFEAFGHELTMSVLGIESVSVVYFFADPNITKNVLGRQGWLDRIRLGLIDHDQELYLAAYDEVVGAGRHS
jgi:hypothetical protein